MRIWWMRRRYVVLGVAVAAVVVAVMLASAVLVARNEPFALAILLPFYAVFLAVWGRLALVPAHRVILRDDDALELRAVIGTRVVPIADLVAVRRQYADIGSRGPVELVTPTRTYTMHRNLTPDLQDLIDEIELRNDRIDRHAWA